MGMARNMSMTETHLNLRQEVLMRPRRVSHGHAPALMIYDAKQRKIIRFGANMSSVDVEAAMKLFRLKKKTTNNKGANARKKANI